MRESAVRIVKERQGKKMGLAGELVDALSQQVVLQRNPPSNENPSQDEVNNLFVQFQSGQHALAKKLALEITQNHPNHPFAYKVLGALFKTSGRLHDAVIANQKVVTLTPNDEEAHNNLGNTLQELGRLVEAEASCRHALEIKPDFAEAHNNLGNILKELGKLAEAETSFRQAIALNPDFAQVHCNLGFVLQELGKLAEAEASYRQAVTLKPNFAEAYLALGKHSKIIGQNSKAVEYFQQALNLDFEESLGASLELAYLGIGHVPEKTPIRYMQEFYKKKSKIWSGSANRSLYRGHLLIENAFKQTHELGNKVEILDLGCGIGSLAKFLRLYSKNLVGVDLSPHMLIEADKTQLYDSLHEKDLIQYLGEVSNCYDSVVAAATLIHFFNLENIFSLVRQSLKSNGKFIFSTFEGKQKDSELNNFLMYAHSDDYISTLSNRLNFRISYRQKDIHEYHGNEPVRSIIYVLEKIN